MSASTTTNTQINLLEELEPAKERMFKFGADALSNAELLSLLLRTGTREHSATELALQLLKSNDGSLSKLLFRSPQELAETTGVGPAKAATLAAVLELARRVAREQMEQKTMLDSPEVVCEYLGLTLRGLEYEAFVVLFLNSQHRLMASPGYAALDPARPPGSAATWRQSDRAGCIFPLFRTIQRPDGRFQNHGTRAFHPPSPPLIKLN